MNQSRTELLRCHVDVPAEFVPKARFALETLLAPIALNPAWTDDNPDFYYGPAPSESSAAISVRLDAATHSYFARRAAYERELAFQAYDLTFLFGAPDAPDPVASAFFLVSGWDEYVTDARDEHARFCYRHSLQHDLDIALTPLVDRYRDFLARRLRAAGFVVRRRTWDGQEWAFLPTFDVDYLREWRPGTVLQKGLRRPWAVVRDLMTGADAYRDGLHHLLATLAANESTGTFFFKGGDRSAYDPSYRRSDRELTRLLNMVREQGSEVGLHPGYYAATHAGYMQAERARLESLIETPLRSVRQHYLRFDLTATPRLHAAEGLRIDSTLGFPDHEGFRRGTCLPFRIFDPAENRALDVWELPMAFMDATMIVRRGFSAEASREVLEELMNTCREAGGACVALWHNTLWERGMEGWPEHLDQILARARARSAYIGSLSEALEAWT